MWQMSRARPAAKLLRSAGLAALRGPVAEEHLPAVLYSHLHLHAKFSSTPALLAGEAPHTMGKTKVAVYGCLPSSRIQA